MKRRKFATNPRFVRPRLEELESRCLLANLVWTNRGQVSDRFGDVFGGQADAARQVVDAVLASWSTVLVNLNQPPVDATADRNTINFNISMHPTRTGFGGGATITNWAYPTEADKAANRNGHPTAGDFSLDRGMVGEPNNGWWIDPTPAEHSEFTNILSPFAAQRPDDAVGTDIYGTINAEIAHILGLFDTAPSRLQTPVSGTVSKTTLNDRSHGNGVGFYYVFDGPSGSHLLTSYDSGSGDVGGPTHTAGPTAPNFPVQFNSTFRNPPALRLTGGIDPGNAAGGANTRSLASDNLAQLFKDAFGYEVRLPSTIPGANFAVAVQGGALNVRGGPDGDGAAAPNAGAAAANQGGAAGGAAYDTFIPSYVDRGGTSADRITFLRDGDDVLITVDFGRDGPVNGLDPDGDGNAPSFQTRVPLDSFTSINLDSDGGNDTVVLDFSGGDFLPAEGLLLNGDLGTDKVIVIGSQAYRIDGTVLTLPGLGTVSLESVAEVQLIGTELDDTFEIRDWSGALTLEGLEGSDTYAIDWSTRTTGMTRIADNGGANDLLRVVGSPTADAVLVTGSVVRRLGATVDFRGAAIEQLTIDGAAGADVLSVLLSPVGTFVRMFGGPGNDVLTGASGQEFLSGGEGNDVINSGSGDDILLGGSGNDTLTTRPGQGRSLLIGGVGRDLLTGGGAGSLLIGGTTEYDNDEAALGSIAAVWALRDLTYAQRLAQLRGGGPINGTNVLTAAKVPADGARDTLFGALGRDWYWLSNLDLDQVVGKASNELVN